MSDTVYTAAFIFEPGEYDEEFYKLDAQIEEFAQSIDGYIKTERWNAREGNVKNSVYYFSSQEAIRTLATYEPHKAAKAKYKKWYRGYRIEISTVISSYGDGNLE